MIPLDHIVAWRARAPWPLDSQVEQDLVLSLLPERMADFDLHEGLDAVLGRLVALLPGDARKGGK